MPAPSSNSSFTQDRWPDHTSNSKQQQQQDATRRSNSKATAVDGRQVRRQIQKEHIGHATKARGSQINEDSPA
jgi:hypothetical protein